MDLTCPQCNQQLPKVKTLEYRFCPHCGAEIAAEPQQLDDAFLTLPPDLPPAQADHSPMDLSREAEKKITVTRPFDDQTTEPQPLILQNRPEIKPPTEPPPSGLFRMSPKRLDSPTRDEKKQPSTKNHNKVIIVVLILLAAIILIMGGVFTF